MDNGEQLNQLSEEILGYREGSFEEMVSGIRTLKILEAERSIYKNRNRVIQLCNDLAGELIEATEPAYGSLINGIPEELVDPELVKTFDDLEGKGLI